MQEVFEKIIEKLEEYEYENLVEHDSEQSQHCKDAGDCKGMDCSLCVFNKAIEIVKQTAAEHNNGWIPCSEPPKTSDYILLSFSNFSVPMVGRYEENEDGGAYYIGDEDKSCVSQDIFVNAWQPLPEPYQTKGE